jgi:hypothetical protein
LDWSLQKGEVLAFKDDITYRHQIFELTHKEKTLDSEIVIFEQEKEIKCEMFLGIDKRGVYTLIGYVPSERQSSEISKDRWDTHLAALETSEAEKTATVRSSIQNPVTSQSLNCYVKRKDPLSWVV